MMGCGTISPSLYPIPKINENFKGESKGQITFFVKPVITTGFSREERREYKVDLSAHFTSFEVTVLNGTSYPVEIKPELFSIMEDDGSISPSLSIEESLDYFRTGDEQSREAVHLVSKPYFLIKEEIEALKNLYLHKKLLEPGTELRGLVFFKKISPDHCEHVKLMVQDIIIKQTGETKKIAFHFSCQPTGFDKMGLLSR